MLSHHLFFCHLNLLHKSVEQVTTGFCWAPSHGIIQLQICRQDQKWTSRQSTLSLLVKIDCHVMVDKALANVRITNIYRLGKIACIILLIIKNMGQSKSYSHQLLWCTHNAVSRSGHVTYYYHYYQLPPSLMLPFQRSCIYTDHILLLVHY